MCVFIIGTVFLAAGQSEDSDILWTISSDAFPFQRQLRETQVNIQCAIDLRKKLNRCQGQRGNSKFGNKTFILVLPYAILFPAQSKKVLYTKILQINALEKLLAHMQSMTTYSCHQICKALQ